MTYKISSGVQIPVHVQHRGWRAECPYEGLDVGDSFHIPKSDISTYDPLKTITNATRRATKEMSPKCFKAFEVGENDPQGVGFRVFRMKDLTPDQIASRQRRGAHLRIAAE